MSINSPGNAAGDARRTALRVLIGAGMLVVAAFIAARLGNGVTAHLFDYAHWTIATAAAVFLGWLGVRCAEEQERAPRRWFARGLTFVLAAQLLFDMQEMTHWTPIPNLSD